MAFSEWVTWGLTKLLKVLVKKHLAHFLATEVDVNQLGVQLDTGTLELRECLLDVDYLNERLASSPVELVSAYAGSVRLTLVPAALAVHDVLIVVRPRAQPAAPSGGAGAAEDGGAALEGAAEFAESSISEGMRLIAGGLESLLQRLKVQGQRIVVRLEASHPPSGRKQPCPGHALALNIDGIEYGGGDMQAAEAAAAAGAQQLQLAKTVAFSGLAVQLVEGSDATRDGCQPRSLLSGGAGEHGCSGRADLGWSCGVQHHSRPLLDINVQLSRGLELHIMAHTLTSLGSLLRDFTAVGTAAGASAGQTVQSAPSPRREEAIRAASWGTRSVIEALLLPDGKGLVMDALRPVAGISGQASVLEEVDEFFDAISSQSLLGSRHSSAASSLYASAAEPSDPHAALHDLTASIRERSHGDLDLSFAVRRLEAAEHLPTETAEQQGGAKLAEESALLPNVLPAHPFQWSSPPSSGHPPSAFGDTLSELSELLSQPREATGAVVLHVLRCGHVGPGTSATGSAVIGHMAALPTEPATSTGRVTATLAMLPVTLWVNVPFLGRVAKFAEALGQQQQQQQHNAVQRTQPAHSSACGPDSPESRFSMAIYTPHVSVLSPVPPPAGHVAAFDGDLTAHLAATAAMDESGGNVLLHLMSRHHPPPMGRIKDAMHRLRIDGVKPAVQADCRGSRGAWEGEGEVAVGSVAAFLVARQRHGGALSPHPLAQLPGGLEIGVRYQPRLSSRSSVLEQVWGMVGGALLPEPAGVDVLRVRERCISASALYISASAPELRACLGPPSLAALVGFGDALAALQASLAARPAVSQTSVLLECAHARLVCGGLPTKSLLTAEAHGADVFFSANLGCMQGASAAACSLTALQLSAPAAGQPSVQVVKRVAPHDPSVSVVYVARPTGDGSEPSQTGQLVPPTGQRACLSVAGLAVVGDFGDGPPHWLEDLRRAFDIGAPEPSVRPQVDFALAAREVAIVHLPQRDAAGEASVSAALALSGAYRHATTDTVQDGLDLRSASLHVAEQGAHAAHAVPACSSAVAWLAAAGYCSIAQEEWLAARWSNAVDTSHGPAAADVEPRFALDLTNRQCNVSLNKHSAQLLRALLQQTAAMQGRDAARPAAAPSPARQPQPPILHGIHDIGTGRERSAASLQTSVFVEGGWYGQVDTSSLQQDPLAAGDSSASELDEEEQQQRPSSADAGGRWYSGVAGLSSGLIEDYVQVAPEDEWFRGIGSAGSAALSPLPSGYPPPAATLLLHDVRITVTLADSFEVAGHGHVHAQVQVRLAGVALRASVFCPGTEYLHRTALSVQHLSMWDCLRPEEGAPPAGARWRSMLTCSGAARDAAALEFVAEAVQPAPGEGLEWRLHGAVQPMQLDLDQLVVSFLQHFSATANSGAWEVVGKDDGDQLQAASEDCAFIQRCQIEAFVLTLNYKPRSVDVAALRSGSVAEVVNLVPWGAKLQFRRLRLYAVEGLPALGATAAATWINDIGRYQLHKFVTSIAPIRSLCRVGTAAAQLAALPMQSPRSATGKDFQRQLTRATVAFVRAVAVEGLNAGAAVAGAASSSAASGRVQRKLRSARDSLK